MGEIIRRLIRIRLTLGLDLDTITLMTSSRCGDSGAIGRNSTIHFRCLVPGLGPARSSGGGRRSKRRRRRLGLGSRLGLGLWLWRLLSFSEEIVTSPLQYIPHMEAYHSS